MGNISEEAMLAYVTQLYSHADANDMICDLVMTSLANPFTTKDVQNGLLKMANGKALDTMNISTELIKWIGDRAKACLAYILEHALTHGFPTDWQANQVQPLQKLR